MSRIKKINSSVSIITVTQLIRAENLLILYDLIISQSYNNIIDWVIVEGSKTIEDGNKNKINIDKLKEYSKIKINYIEYSGKKLSDLRNLGNSACIGDIIVCMDDDDYYPPERVSHAVESLNNSNYLLAGCSDIYLYEYFMKKLYKFKGFGDKHSTNNCMAFKREYLINHKHASGLDMAEEPSFNNNHSEPMVQLVSKKCVIVSSHDLNTFNKRDICVGCSIGLNPTLYEVNEPITNYIPKDIFKRMNNLFFKEEDSKYDIVYLCGGFAALWDPTDGSLGGSEQAVVNLSEYWVKQDYKVAVYADIKSGNLKDLTYNGVDYINWRKFPFNHQFKTLILWRANGLFSGGLFTLNAKNVFWDLHDTFFGQDLLIAAYHENKNKINKLLLKSDFHKDEFEKYFKIKLKENDYVIIPNGIRIDKFSKNIDNVSRDPYRFCYVSYYTRGLPHISVIFSIIKTLEPRAELHLYYGMNMIEDNKVKEQIRNMIKQPGIIDHGRQSVDIIVREKYMSSFQLYITNTDSEIDCISIKESLLTGCIPLISNYGVFKQREGIHFDLVENDQCLNKIAHDIIKLLKDKKQLDIWRNIFKKSPTILSWSDTGRMLLDVIN